MKRYKDLMIAVLACALLGLAVVFTIAADDDPYVSDQTDPGVPAYNKTSSVIVINAKARWYFDYQDEKDEGGTWNLDFMLKDTDGSNVLWHGEISTTNAGLTTHELVLTGEIVTNDFLKLKKALRKAFIAKYPPQ